MIHAHKKDKIPGQKKRPLGGGTLVRTGGAITKLFSIFS